MHDNACEQRSSGLGGVAGLKMCTFASGSRLSIFAYFALGGEVECL